MKKNSSRSVEMKATVERKGRMNNAPGGTVSHRPDYQAVGSKTMAVFQTAQVHDHGLTRTAAIAPFLSPHSLQNRPRRQPSAAPRKTSASLTAPGRSTDLQL